MRAVLLALAILSGLFALLVALDDMAVLAVVFALGLVVFDIYFAFFSERAPRGRRG